MYTPAPDEAAHTYAGFLDPLIPGHDSAMAEKLWPVLARAFEIEDRLLGWVMDQAEVTGAHVLLVSDHGMAGTRRLFHVNVALARAGLLALTPERRIDLSRTRAVLLPTSDASVAINTVNRKGGIVALEDKTKVVEEVQKVLAEFVDPDTDRRIVTGFYEPSRKGLLQPGGETTGDLFLDLAPGYYFSFATDKEEYVSATAPTGNHIFLPTRRDMLAIFGLWGPTIPAGRKLHRVRGIDVVPTVLDILDIERPEELPGTSLLPQSTLIDTLSSKKK
jgi:predicted AlkP superfamily phosphohydrolase/phosphomutase